MSQPGTETPKDTLTELAEIRAQARNQAGSRKDKSEDPPVKEDDSEIIPTIAVKEEDPPAPAGDPEPEELIRIGDKTFKTQSEAIKYAERLEHEKEIAEAHSMGVQEALRVTGQAAPPPAEEPEENFEEQFYADPKGTLQRLKQSAKSEVKEELKKEQAREDQWKMFFSENPDLEGLREESEKILAKNLDTLGPMPVEKARKILATKVRSYVQELADRLKPRTDLPNKGGQVVSSGGGSVTPPKSTKKEERVLDFVSELRNARRR